MNKEYKLEIKGSKADLERFLKGENTAKHLVYMLIFRENPNDCIWEDDYAGVIPKNWSNNEK